jgi:hypothetical protein
MPSSWPATTRYHSAPWWSVVESSVVSQYYFWGGGCVVCGWSRKTFHSPSPLILILIPLNICGFPRRDGRRGPAVQVGGRRRPCIFWQIIQRYRRPTPGGEARITRSEGLGEDLVSPQRGRDDGISCIKKAWTNAVAARGCTRCAQEGG